MKKYLIMLITILSVISCSKKPGKLTGNVYWKYNNYVGNKPDAGAKVSLFVIDKNKKDSIFETTTDVNGNYTINDIPPAKYLLVIQSENTTSSPKEHLDNLKNYSKEMKQLFGFDLNKYATTLKEIDNDYIKYEEILTDMDYNKYGGLSNKIDECKKYQKNIDDKSANLIDKLPKELKIKLGLYTGYSKSLDINNIEIKEDKTINQNTDFGTTYQ